MSQADGIISGVVGWLDRRAAAAPETVKGSWRSRADLYRGTAGMTAIERNFIFGMTKSDPTFDPRTLERHILDPVAAVGVRVTGPPNLLTIRLSGELGLFDTAELEAQIASAVNIRLLIDSNGGDFITALRLHELLEGRNVTAIVEAKAFSAAGFILQAAKHRAAKADAQIMVHAAAAFVAGNAAELRTIADLAEKCTRRMQTLFARRTGQPAEVVDGWFTGGDRYFTAREALAVGLIDEVLT